MNFMLFAITSRWRAALGLVAQLAQVVGNVEHGAEVDLAFHADHLQLRASGQRCRHVGALDERAVGLGAVEAHHPHEGPRRAMQVSHQRKDRAKQDRHLEAHRDRGENGGGRDREVGPAVLPQAPPGRDLEQ